MLYHLVVPSIRHLEQYTWNGGRAGDRRWLMTVEGTGADYSGEAVNPRYLSLFEIALGYGKRYRGATRLRIPSSLDLRAVGP